MRVLVLGAGGARRTEASIVRAVRSLDHHCRFIDVVGWCRRLGPLAPPLVRRLGEAFRPEAVILTRHSRRLGDRILAGVRRVAPGVSGISTSACRRCRKWSNSPASWDASSSRVTPRCPPIGRPACPKSNDCFMVCNERRRIAPLVMMTSDGPEWLQKSLTAVRIRMTIYVTVGSFHQSIPLVWIPSFLHG